MAQLFISTYTFKGKLVHRNSSSATTEDESGAEKANGRTKPTFAPDTTKKASNKPFFRKSILCLFLLFKRFSIKNVPSQVLKRAFPTIKIRA
jgi:hypothetical protein